VANFEDTWTSANETLKNTNQDYHHSTSSTQSHPQQNESNHLEHPNDNELTQSLADLCNHLFIVEQEDMNQGEKQRKKKRKSRATRRKEKD